MKKLLLSIIVIASTAFAYGQNDPAAKKLLTEVSKKYNSYKTIQSDFTLSVQDANKKNYSDAGEMFFNKPKKEYAIILKDQEFISNGKSVWNISKDIKEVQITDAENDNSSIGPNNLFTFYQSGYKYLLMEDEKITKNGKTEILKVVELSPIDTKTNYYKIKLRINSNNHIHDVTIFDKSNNRYTYTIQSLYLGKNLPPSIFSFNKEKYPGYEIVDLR
ncbi:LolA family protein [Sphingobacterium rhinopitheci]|uniref:LolA family protein n=1 Tax=Sphingobacterium rhinopitheci TaxID=2781960 RepID=UPI001F51BAA9|nr:outer membrane lipoprotein carrier protein LolA [Sphingobacterium rhinopitheci]MCI0922160.1 outer membrane lipoprotein carrier protein LolA [Sphingobacterium rhinopitheci]